MKLTILGSGTSHGIPVVGCNCPVCRSTDTRDKRMRCSLYIQGAAGEQAIIDMGPEFRLQALRAGMPRLDAVFLTHAHADHLHGLDDIRPLSREKPIPIYGNRRTIAEFRERFSYIFKPTQQGGGKPQVETFIVDGPVRLGNLTVTPIPVQHGALDILGYRIDEFAGQASGREPPPVGPAGESGGAVYLTDTSHIDQAGFKLTGRPELLIIGGLRVRPHETHFTFSEALTTAAKTGTPQVYLTHICHEHFHREIEEYCGEFIKKEGLYGIKADPAWDGLEIQVLASG